MTTTSNVDPAELAKFSDLAHRWWDPESEFRPLHQINPLRFEWINSLAPLAGQRVLDVGCGGGILADAMARKGADVLGIDLATKSLRVAQLHGVAAGPGEPLGAFAAADFALVDPPAQLGGGSAAGFSAQGQALARGGDVGVEREDGAVLRGGDARGDGVVTAADSY